MVQCLKGCIYYSFEENQSASRKITCICFSNGNNGNLKIDHLNPDEKSDYDIQRLI